MGLGSNEEAAGGVRWGAGRPGDGDGDGDEGAGEAGWRVAAPPSGNTVAPVVWAVPAGVRWHAPVVEAGTLAAQYVAAAAVILAVVRAPVGGAGAGVPPQRAPVPAGGNSS